MTVHLVKKSKGDVYEQEKNEFKNVFLQLEVLEKQRQEVNAGIQANIGPFSHIVA